MKRIAILLTVLLFSFNTNAALVTFIDGADSTDLSVEFVGAGAFDGVNDGFLISDAVLATIQLKLLDLELADDLNDDGLITVQFAYLDALSNFLGFDGFSFAWADIVSLQGSADLNDELVFSSNVLNSVLSFTGSMAGTDAAGADYFVGAFVEGVPIADVAFGVNLIAKSTEVPAPLGLSLLAMGLLGMARIRRKSN